MRHIRVRARALQMYLLGAALVIKVADWWFSSQQGVEIKDDVLPVPPPPGA